ncbi:MAG: glycosyltransferase family 39 protein [Chloroflexi bacterium]|nr:glycosyltransferase family 39 protein [Chloroflexota bacterium]
MEHAQVIQGDETLYHRAALNIASGHGYSYSRSAPYLATNHRMPGFPFFLSVLYSITGPRPWTAIVVHVLVSLVTIALLHRLCLYAFDASVAGVCAWLMALYPLDVVSTMTLLREPLFLVFLTASWFAWVAYALRGRLSHLAASAAFLSLSAYLRDNAVYQVFALAPLLLMPDARGTAARRRFLAIALFVGVFAACLAPWAWRNHRRIGTWQLTSAGGSTMLTGNGAYLLAKKHGCDFEQMIHVLHHVLLKRYAMPSQLPPEIQAALRGTYVTNDGLVNSVSPSWFHSTNEPVIQLHSVQDISDAQAKLFSMIVRDNMHSYLGYMCIGVVKIIFTPLWQETMRIMLPALDSGRFATAVVHADIEWLRGVGLGALVCALTAAMAMTLFDLAVGIAGIAGLILFLRTGRNAMLKATWCSSIAYTLLVSTGPCAVSRFRYGLLPFMLPLAAFALVTLADWYSTRHSSRSS